MLIAPHRHCPVYPDINHACSSTEDPPRKSQDTGGVEGEDGSDFTSPSARSPMRESISANDVACRCIRYRHLFGNCRWAHHATPHASLSNLFKRSRLPGLSELRSSALFQIRRSRGNVGRQLEQRRIQDPLNLSGASPATEKMPPQPKSKISKAPH